MEPKSVCQHIAADLGIAQLVGSDAAFAAVVEKIKRVAAYDAPVMIVGETGTGKELCAHAIHHLSKRAYFPFVPVECGAVPDLLAENELFGHARGAYTDAHRDQKGLAALADGGTLFLDEIDSLSLPSQSKLLRFLEDGTYRSLGAERLVRANVRIIAACNRDLAALVRQKEFRADLYFRLDVLKLRLPPLRERRGDIPLLAEHFLESFAAAQGSLRKKLSPGALQALLAHDWPGNIRELRNVVQRAIVFGGGLQISASDLALPGTELEENRGAPDFREARRLTIEKFERVYVEEALRAHGGNITRAALAARQDRRSFGRLVKKYGVRARAFAPPAAGRA